MSKSQQLQRARSLRSHQTKTEALVWSILRGKQVNGLKFRRQHAIDPFIVDFACVTKMLVVEIDGEYHDTIRDQDLEREAFLRSKGWDILRFSVDDVTLDPECVARAIVDHLHMEYQFSKRSRRGAGMENETSTNRGRC